MFAYMSFTSLISFWVRNETYDSSIKEIGQETDSAN